MNAPLNWDHLRSFLAVLEGGSLSAAARALGLTQPTVARHIELLEASLAAKLFSRAPSGLTPTDTARRLEPRAREMAMAAAALERAAQGAPEHLSGLVRIAASNVVGAEVLPSILRDLRAEERGLCFEIELSDSPSDLLRREADIAVRMTPPSQKALVARHVGDARLGLHAHVEYLAQRGRPYALTDLKGHDLIGFDREIEAARRIIPGAVFLQRDQFAYLTDNHLAQLAAIRAGCGIGVCQTGLAARDPALERLFADEFDYPMQIWIVMHEDLRRDQRMRRVFNHLASAFARYAASG